MASVNRSKGEVEREERQWITGGQEAFLKYGN
jgi:hypothetical protein